MGKIADKIIIIISIVLIGFVMIFSLMPKMVLDSIVTISGFAIPIFLIIITMIIEIKRTNDMQEKAKIRRFWLKTLFIIYCLLLVTILFLNNEYRINAFQGSSTFSLEHLEESNFVPFRTIINYIRALVFQNTKASIVILNLGVNLFLFVPMGFFIPILFNDKIKNIRQFILIMLVITLTVEILQLVTGRGSADIDDIILNIIGATIVYGLMKTKFIKKVLEKVLEIS